MGMSTDVKLFFSSVVDSYGKLISHCAVSSPCCKRVIVHTCSLQPQRLSTPTCSFSHIGRRNHMIHILTSVNPLPASGFIIQISARHTDLQ